MSRCGYFTIHWNYFKTVRIEICVLAFRIWPWELKIFVETCWETELDFAQNRLFKPMVMAFLFSDQAQQGQFKMADITPADAYQATGMNGKMPLFVGFSRKMDCLPAVMAMVHSGNQVWSSGRSVLLLKPTRVWGLIPWFSEDTMDILEMFRSFRGAPHFFGHLIWTEGGRVILSEVRPGGWVRGLAVPSQVAFGSLGMFFFSSVHHLQKDLCPNIYPECQCCCCFFILTCVPGNSGINM